MWCILYTIQIHGMDRENRPPSLRVIAATQIGNRFYQNFSKQSELRLKKDAIDKFVQTCSQVDTINTIMEPEGLILQALINCMPQSLKHQCIEYTTAESCLQRTIKSNTSPVSSIAISPNNEYILTGDCDGSAKIWCTQTGALLHTLMGHNNLITSVVISPNNTYAATGDYDGSVKIWDTQTGVLNHTLHEEDDPIKSLYTILDDSRLLTFIYKNNNTYIWDTQTESLKYIHTGHNTLVKETKIYWCNQYSGTIYNDKARDIAHIHFKINIIPDNKNINIKTIPAPVISSGLEITVNRNTCTKTTTPNTTILIKNIQNPNENIQISGHINHCSSYETPKINNSLLTQEDTSSRDSRENPGHTNADITCKSFSLNRDIELTGYSNGTITVQNRKTGMLEHTFKMNTDQIESASILAAKISLDGNYVVTGANNGMVVVWRRFINHLKENYIKNLSLQEMLLLIIYADMQARNTETSFDEIKSMYMQKDINTHDTVGLEIIAREHKQQLQHKMIQKIFESSSRLPKELKKFINILVPSIPEQYVQKFGRRYIHKRGSQVTQFE